MWIELSNGGRVKLQFKHEVGGKFLRGTRIVKASTLVEVLDEHGKEISSAEAFCSLGDNFSKAVGRKIALGRALSGWPRERRTEIWNAYWKATNGNVS